MLFPRCFRDTIPVQALILVVTAVRSHHHYHSVRVLISCHQIKASLEEYTTGVFISTKFDAELYGKVHAYMMSNLDAVLAHPYHGPRVNETISRWARTSRYVLCISLGVRRINISL